MGIYITRNAIELNIISEKGDGKIKEGGVSDYGWTYARGGGGIQMRTVCNKGGGGV